MTDLGEISWILGVQVIWDHTHKAIVISQEKYINNILEKHGQQNTCPMATPSLPNKQLEKLKEPEPDVNIRQYQSTVGTLMYAMLGTHLDLAYTVSILSQHTTMLGKAHVHMLSCTFQYLQAIAHHTLRFNGNETGELTSFVDTDWAVNINDHHSILGYIDVPGVQMAMESCISYPFVFPFCQLSCIDIFAFVSFAFFTFCLPNLSHFPMVCCIASHHLSHHLSCTYHSYASPCYGLTVQTPSSLALSLPLTIMTFLVVPAHSPNSD